MPGRQPGHPAVQECSFPWGSLGLSWRGDNGDGAARQGHGQLPLKLSWSTSQEQTRLPQTSASEEISQSGTGQKQRRVPLLLFSVSSLQGNNCSLFKEICLGAALLDAFAGLSRGCRLSRAGHSRSHRLCLPLPLHRMPLPAFHPSPSLSFPFPLFTLSSGRAQAAAGEGYGNLWVLSTGGGFACWLPVHWSPLPLEVGQNEGETFPLASPPLHSDMSFPCPLLSAWQRALLLWVGLGQ